MAKNTTFDLPAVVDAFVCKINGDPREPGRLDEVPEFLREIAADDRPLNQPTGGPVGASSGATTPLGSMNSKSGREASFLLRFSTCWPTTLFRPLNSGHCSSRTPAR